MLKYKDYIVIFISILTSLSGSSIGALFGNGRFVAEDRYFKAVERARFFNEDERKKWIVMGSYLSVKELIEAEKAILNEDLRALNVKQKLHKLKPKAA